MRILPYYNCRRFRIPTQLLSQPGRYPGIGNDTPKSFLLPAILHRRPVPSITAGRQRRGLRKEGSDWVKERSFWVNKKGRADRSMSTPTTSTLYPEVKEPWRFIALHVKPSTRLESRPESPDSPIERLFRCVIMVKLSRARCQLVRADTKVGVYSQLGSII